MTNYSEFMNRLFDRPRVIMLLGGISLLLLAFTSIGYNHPDEHFQILEFAAWKIGLTNSSELPWEFHYQMRSAIQPSMVVLLYRFFGFFSYVDPFVLSLFLRILTAGLTFLTMIVTYRRFRPEIEEQRLGKWFLWLTFLLWFNLYNGVRFTSEIWSGNLFMLALCWLSSAKKPQQGFKVMLFGFLLGIAFLFRYQVGLLIVGFVGWALVYDHTIRSKVRWFIALSCGIALAFAVGLLIDHWFYGHWVVTLWNYFEQNLLEGKMDGFGVEPWWFYFWDVFNRAVPPFSLVYIVSFLVLFLFFRKSMLTWTLLPFIVFHFLLGHKETRFFFPILGFIPIVIIQSLEFIRGSTMLDYASQRVFTTSVKLFGGVNVLLVVACFFNPADIHVNLYERVYHQYPQGARMFYFTENPYHRAKQVYFYRNPRLIIRQGDTSTFVPPDGQSKVLVVVRNKDPEYKIFRNEKLVYSTYPEWIKLFNFNGWLDRSQVWSVFEIDPRQNHKFNPHP